MSSFEQRFGNEELASYRSRKWLSLPEACAYSGRSRSTILRRVLSGHIAGHKPDGCQWEIDRESIDAFFTPPVSKAAVDIVRSLRR